MITAGQMRAEEIENGALAALCANFARGSDDSRFPNEPMATELATQRPPPPNSQMTLPPLDNLT